MMTKRIFVLILAFLSIDQVQGHCYTAWGSQGRCVNIKQCNRLLMLLKKRPILPAVLNVLRRAQCGFEGLDPKVCCENTQDDNSIEFSDFTSDISPVEIEMETTTTTTTTTTSTIMTVAPPPLIPVYDHANLRLLNDDLCGPVTEGRIYGGNMTSIHEFPWMALLGYDVDAESVEFRCGASIISKRYVLSAAHCTSGLPKNLKLVTVRMGDHDLSQERDCDVIEDGVGFNCAEKYQDFGIERLHVHPDFTRHKLHNDISLIRIDREANFDPTTVRPICLPLGNTAFMRPRKAVVTGWGSTEFGIRSNRLLKVTLPIVSMEKCIAAYRNQMVKIWHKQICAGGTDKMDSCSGDSGGPLQAVAIYDGKPRTVQYGIVSFGPHGCGLEQFPGVYTSVAHYVKWILDTMTD